MKTLKLSTPIIFSVLLACGPEDGNQHRPLDAAEAASALTQTGPFLKPVLPSFGACTTHQQCTSRALPYCVAGACVAAPAPTSSGSPSFTPPSITYLPPYSGQGDRDFDGNGPIFGVTVQLHHHNRSVYADVYMLAVESTGDRTQAEGRRTFLLHTGSRRIAAIESDTYSQAWGMVESLGEVIDLPASEAVRQFIVLGDRSGDDAGVYTRAMINFNPIRLRYQ